MKFIADSMVGRLAKWLRLLGFDVLYCSNISHSDLLRIGREENRLILTRDTLLMQVREVKSGRNKVLFIKSEQLFDQLKQVIDDLGLKPDLRSSRCKYDNNRLQKVNKSEVKDKVPEYVYKTQKEFVKCNKCQKIYWKATHYKNIEHKLEELGLN